MEDQPADKDIPMPGDVNFLVQQLSVSIVTASQIASWTEKDVVMSQVTSFYMAGQIAVLIHHFNHSTLAETSLVL